MKARRKADGTWTVSGIDENLLLALTHAAGDLGSGAAILHYDPNLYHEFAAPTKARRKAFVKFARLADSEIVNDYFEHFEDLDEPPFKKAKR